MRILISRVFNGVNYSLTFSLVYNNGDLKEVNESQFSDIKKLYDGCEKFLTIEQFYEFRKNNKVFINTTPYCTIGGSSLFFFVKLKDYKLLIFNIIQAQNKILLNSIVSFSNFKELNVYLNEHLNFEISKDIEDKYISQLIINKFVK